MSYLTSKLGAILLECFCFHQRRDFIFFKVLPNLPSALSSSLCSLYLEEVILLTFISFPSSLLLLLQTFSFKLQGIVIEKFFIFFFRHHVRLQGPPISIRLVFGLRNEVREIETDQRFPICWHGHLQCRNFMVRYLIHVPMYVYMRSLLDFFSRSMITAPVILVIGNQQNASYCFISLANLFCCYLSMALIFIPKITFIRQHAHDPREKEDDEKENAEQERKYRELLKINEDLQKKVAEVSITDQRPKKRPFQN